ncbi:hypothetical protein COCNU_scaffold001097G000030 [Cocos nucifera]|nr:hypothetical protein [Cocos nucifera]
MEEDQLDALTSESSDTSGPHDHLSLVLGSKHSRRIRCRPEHTLTSYWSEASVSSQTSGAVSRKELEAVLAWADHAATWADQTEERASHLEDIMRDMVSTLSTYFEGAFMGFEDMLVRIPAPALPPARASSFEDDDDVDLGDF